MLLSGQIKDVKVLFEGLFSKKIGPTEMEIGTSIVMSVREVAEKVLAASPETIQAFRDGNPNDLFFRGLLVSDRDAESFFSQAEEKFSTAWGEARNQERDTRASAERAIATAVQAIQTYLSARDEAITTQQAANKLELSGVPDHNDQDHLVPEALHQSLWDLVQA